MSNTPIDLSRVSPDFESLVTALQNNLKNRNSWKDLYVEGTGETLIEYAAAIGTFDQWSIEKAFKEAFIGTADIDSSIYAGARFLGIRISRKLPGVQTCTLQRNNSLNLPVSQTLIVPAYSQFYINTNIPFFNRIPLNYLNYSSSIETLLYQGMVYTKSFTSSGTAFQQILIPSINSMSISDIDVIVTVNGDPWTIINDGLWHYNFDSKVVADATLGSGDVILQFGNGINGVVPPAGAIINVTYVETLGSKQGLLATGSSVSGASQINGYELSGKTIKSTTTNLVSTNLISLPITLTSLTDTLPKAYLPTGNFWDVTYVGLQLECSGGLALIIGINKNEASLSIINPFSSLILSAGSFSITQPSTGLDEKSSSYYKVMAPYLRRADNRAVTVKDHSVILTSYPGITDVLVRTEKDLVQTRIIQKSAAVIAREKLQGIYTSDFYEIKIPPNPALYNVVWISLLTQNGITLTSLEKEALLSWFESKQFVGSKIIIQDPIKTLVNLRLKLYCTSKSDPSSVTIQARTIMQDMFSTSQPMLSKRITITDINKKLLDGLSGNLDYFELSNLIQTGSTFTASTLSDSDLTPNIAGIDTNGLPIPPGYLYLNTLDIISQFTDRR